jgi:periplasmic protein TonB
MFEDSLFDSGAGSRPRKTWPKVVSFAIEVCAIGVLVLLPFIYTQALPKQLWTNILEAPTPPPGPAPERVERREAPQPRLARELNDGVLREPSRIPLKTAIVHDELSSAEGPLGMVGVVPGGVPGGVANSVITEIARATPPVMVKPVSSQKLRVSSGVAAGMLVHQVKPQYPPIAVQARIQGTVVLQAVIGKDGRIQELRLVSGHPMLAPAAIEAVKQWRYRPYLLNSEPVEVDTQINVNFTLGGG